jgi:CheY-like chemotaxis protein
MPTVLIVDDEFGIAEIIADFLIDINYQVTTAINGKQALASIQHTRPDLILLDVMMPVMTGPEMLRVLKAHDEHNHIPVIMMSAVGMQSIPVDLRPMLAGFLQKPFTLDQLLDLIAKCLPAG